MKEENQRDLELFVLRQKETLKSLLKLWTRPDLMTESLMSDGIRIPEDERSNYG